MRRFDQIRETMSELHRVLSDRLRKLVAAGVLEATPYREPGRRARKEYRLTGKGIDLYPVMISLLRWGDKHGAGPTAALAPMRFGWPRLKARSGLCSKCCTVTAAEPVKAVVECAAGHAISSPRESLTRANTSAKTRGD